MTFNEFRFSGLKPRQVGKYEVELDRVSADKEKCVVRISIEHLKETSFGFALILNDKQVVFLKSWQVENKGACEVILNKKYFKVSNWGEFPDFIGADEKNTSFEHWVEVAEAQQEKIGYAYFYARLKNESV